MTHKTAAAASDFQADTFPEQIDTQPFVALYMAAMGWRLDSANRVLPDVERQLQAMLNSGADASLVHAGYPYDAFASGQSMH